MLAEPLCAAIINLHRAGLLTKEHRAAFLTGDGEFMGDFIVAIKKSHEKERSTITIEELTSLFSETFSLPSSGFKNKTV